MVSLNILLPELANRYGIQVRSSNQSDGSTCYELIAKLATKTLCISEEQHSLALNDKQKKKLEVALNRFSKGYTNEVVDEIQRMLTNEIPFTQEDLEQILRENTLQIQAENCILLVGQTRCGKTTLLNLLAKREIHDVQKNQVSFARGLGSPMVLEALNPVGEIGHEESKTHDVKIVPLKNVTIADGPGFGDTAGLSKEIPNALMLASIGKKLKGLLYCVKFEDIGSEAGSRWIKDLKNLKNFLGGNADKYAEAIRLVITYIPENTHLEMFDVQAVLKEYLENIDLLGDDTDLMKFRKTLLDGGLIDRITLLEKDDYIDKARRKDKRKALLKDLAGLMPQERPPSASFGISLSEYSRNKLDEGIRLCLEKTRTSTNELHEAIKAYWQKVLEVSQTCSVDLLKSSVDYIAEWKTATLDKLPQLLPLAQLFPEITGKLLNNLKAFENLNDLLPETDHLNVAEECYFAGIRQDIDRVSEMLNSTYVFKASLSSLQEVLESYEVQKSLLDPEAVLGTLDQEVFTLLDKLSTQLSDEKKARLPYLAEESFRAQLADPAKKTMVELLLKNNIFEPFVNQVLHKGQCFNITLNAPRICISKLLKILGDISNTQDIIINGSCIYLDTHLNGDNFKHKSITFNVDKVKVIADVKVKCGMIQMLGELEGSLAFNEENQEWNYSQSSVLRQGWRWLWI